MSNATLEPTDTVEGEKKGRENEARRVIGRAVFAALPNDKRASLGDHAEGFVQDMVDRTLREIHANGWRIHKSNPVCSVCREPLEQEGQPWRDYLASPELQNQLECEKQVRAADAITHREKMESNK